MYSETNQRLASGLVDAAYIRQGAQALQHRANLVKSLLSHRRIPQQPWSEENIAAFVNELSAMDSNNFEGSVGLGEREARIISPLVKYMHHGLGHGIGRSGDIAAVQPKAAGSSLISQLTSCLVLHALHIAGLTRLTDCLVLPMATGMTLLMVFLALKAEKPAAKYALWFRIDQKSCLKSIGSSGLIPVVLDNVVEGEQVTTDMTALTAAVDRLGADNIACVVSTTSCFAPRGCDTVVEIAEYCKTVGIAHVINNAYGVQASKICHVVNEACRVGRVDAVVQSTDKNFLVPVGGAIIASPDGRIPAAVSKSYPGRASVGPSLDVFITLLSLGVSGWTRLLRERKEVFSYIREKLEQFALVYGERVLSSPRNPISLAVTLSRLPGDPKMFGSMAFSRGVSGVRVVPLGEVSKVSGCELVGFGAHCSCYPVPYFTAAAALGLTKQDVDLFTKKIMKVYSEAMRFNTVPRSLLHSPSMSTGSGSVIVACDTDPSGLDETGSLFSSDAAGSVPSSDDQCGFSVGSPP